jgi:hypothetical protein
MSSIDSKEPAYMVVDPIIWQDASLNDREKIMLSFIWGFTRVQRGCFAPASWIAMNFGWDIPFTTQLIQMLEARGWISVSQELGGTARCLSINIPGEKNPCHGDITDVFDIGVEV